MKRLLLAALALLPAACRKPKPPERVPVPTVAVLDGQRMIDFDEKHGAFACRVPADWKAREDDGAGPLVMLFGPAEGPRRGQAVIAVGRYPDGVDKIKTPQDYWDAMKLLDKNPSPLETRVLDGRTVYALHYDAPRGGGREDVVLFPAGAGFFELSHVAPKDSYRATLPVFEELVRSFKPKG